AGTISTYSKKAMPQLTRITAASGAALYFRWPYQAKVMKTFEAKRRPIVIAGTGICGILAPLRVSRGIQRGRAVGNSLRICNSRRYICQCFANFPDSAFRIAASPIWSREILRESLGGEAHERHPDRA